MIMTSRLSPNEAERRWLSLPGAVVAHTLIDDRGILARWVNARDGVHHMVRVRLDEELYGELREKLRVPRGAQDDYRQLPIEMQIEVLEEDLSSRYPVGALVGVSFGIAGLVSQFFTGAIPLRMELAPIVSNDDLKQLPGAVLSEQGSLFPRVVTSSHL